MSKPGRSVLGAICISMSLLASSALAAENAPIQIARAAPYKDARHIADKIVDECPELGEKLAHFVNQYAAKYDVATESVESVDPTASGRVLVVEITDAISSGNAFVGHRKSMSAHAELLEDGESKGSVDFTRNSGGGFGGGYKSSCSVLGRCTKALGKDIAGWLRDRK